MLKRFLQDTDHIIVAYGATDFQKGAEGLSAMINLKYQLGPYKEGCVFIFCNHRKTSIKMLYWDESGFWILMKHLDRNAFRWPDNPDALKKVILREIQWLCDGLTEHPEGVFEDHHPEIVL